MSVTHLEWARRTLARAAAPPAAGKNPDLVLLAADAAGGTLDPAFDARVLPSRQWALS